MKNKPNKTNNIKKCADAKASSACIVRRGFGWYKTLTINQRINAKECFELLCGVKWEQLSFMFTMRERIEIMYNKLLIEGFELNA